jgi:monoamine oxidase
MQLFSSILERRKFLQSFGMGAMSLIGGSVIPNLLVETKYLTKKKNFQHQRVIIIGAGLSGLVSAMELKSAGHEVVILEGRRRPGGRVYTLRNPFSDDLHAEAGAVIYASSYTIANKYIDQFGLKRLDYNVPQLKPHYFLDGKHIVIGEDNVNWPYGVTSEENELGPFGILNKYLIQTLPEDLKDVDSWQSSDSLKNLDNYTLGEYMRHQGASEGALELVRRTQYFGAAIDNGSALSSLIADIGMFFTGASFFLLEGGNDSLPRAMANTLHSEINYGVKVVGIHQAEDKVQVKTYRGDRLETVEGDRVICTVPAPVLRGMDFVPKLDAKKREAINSINYLDTTRTFIQVKEAFWVRKGLSGSAYTDLPIQDILRQPYSMEIDASKRAILESHVRGYQARQLAVMSESEVIDFVTEQIAKIFPEIYKYQEGGVVKAWSNDPFVLSAYSWPKPGYVTSHLDALRRPHGRVHFAGEHTSILRSLMEGALRSGLRAAHEVNDA